MAYELRKRSREPKDYSEDKNKLPRLRLTSGKPRKDNKLYELEVVEEDDLHGRVKVHTSGMTHNTMNGETETTSCLFNQEMKVNL